MTEPAGQPEPTCSPTQTRDGERVSTPAALPRLAAASVLNGGLFLSEWLGVIADDRVMYARRRSGYWSISAGSTVDDAMYPGASDPALRAKANWDWPETMRFDGRVLAHGEAPGTETPKQELTVLADGVLDLRGCRWMASHHDAELEDIAALLASTARTPCR